MTTSLCLSSIHSALLSKSTVSARYDAESEASQQEDKQSWCHCRHIHFPWTVKGGQRREVQLGCSFCCNRTRWHLARSVCDANANRTRATWVTWGNSWSNTKYVLVPHSSHWSPAGSRPFPDWSVMLCSGGCWYGCSSTGTGGNVPSSHNNEVVAIDGGCFVIVPPWTKDQGHY